jgi:predicted mannosyl-3-phosphoglycerate phosphatase (HAD superfamily)
MGMNEDKTHYYKPSITKGEYVSEKELIENLVYPDTMYKKQIQELEQQLQAYKDKEDKLREICDTEHYYNSDKHTINDYGIISILTKAILQILNEGSEK